MTSQGHLRSRILKSLKNAKQLADKPIYTQEQEIRHCQSGRQCATL